MVELGRNITDQRIMETLMQVSDPEIPVLTIVDMGIVKRLELEGKDLHIDIIPTYTGCPAMDTIAMDIRTALEGLGYNVHVNLKLHPAWTTDMISEEGKRRLEEYGIAAPLESSMDKRALLDGEKIVKCTNCGSSNTSLVSQFGSTPCKALFKCDDCLEPFDYFKCLS